MKTNLLVHDPKSISHTRHQAYQAIKNGSFTAAVMVTVLLIGISTYYKWKRLFSEEGEKALIPKKRGRKEGTGRILTPDEETQLQGLIKDTYPTDSRLNYATWTRKAVSELAYNKFNKKVSVRAMGDYLKRWDFTSQKATRHPHQKDPDKVKDWIEKGYQAIANLAVKLNALIFFGDEAGHHSDHNTGKSFSPKGITPQIMSTGKRLVINMVASISITGQMCYMTYTSTMDRFVFIRYLKQLIKAGKGQMIFLIVDNLKVHHAKLVQEFIKENSDKIQIFYLPPYCPELNPDEYLNNMAKQILKLLPQPNELYEFNDILHKTLRSLQKSKQKIINLFNESHLSYVKEGNSKALNNKDN
jgi:transposase